MIVKYPCLLSDVTVNIFPSGKCGSLEVNVTEGVVCAGVKEGGEKACVGDQGGPLMASDPQNNAAMSLVGVARQAVLSSYN